MEIYGFNAKKKKRKLWLIPVCIATALLIALIALGVVLNVTNADRDTISAAVAENTELKQQVSDLTAQVEELQRENSELQEKLDAIPTPAPTDEAIPNVSPEPAKGSTPRN